MEKIFYLLILLLLFISCSSDSSEDLIDPIPDAITYKIDVKSIINQSCAVSGCHNSASNAANLTLETYLQVKNAFSNRGAFARMESTSAPMPPSGNLPSNSIMVIKNWKNQGYID